MNILRYIILIKCFGGAVSVCAQTVISNKSIPQVFDTLEVQTDKLPDRVKYAGTGQGIFWDFNAFTAPYVYQLPVNSARVGKYGNLFEAANGVIKHQDGYEMYTLHQPNQFSIVGYGDYDFMNLGLKKPSYFDNPYPVKRAPLEYQDHQNGTHNLFMPIDNSEIPNEILRALPYTPDSARYVMEITRQASITAEGRIDLHVDQYNVLKESIQETRRKKLEIKSESIPWQDVSELFAGSNIFVKDSLRKEVFWSNKTKVPVAELYIDPVTSEIELVNFTSHPFLANNIKLNSLKQDIFAYPNPTLGKIRFNLINLPSAFYEIQIINLLGVQVWTERYYVNQSKTIKLDFSYLRKGTYFYRLQNEQGKTISTKRLIILKP